MQTIDFLKHWSKKESVEYALDRLFEKYRIRIKKYDDRVLLNYHQLDSPKTAPIAIECRGLILSLPDFNILSRGFDRFFNYGEAFNTLEFSLDKAVFHQKIDGTLISLYFDGIKWCVATRNTAFAEGLAADEYGTFYDLFLNASGLSNLDSIVLDKTYTYLFELVSPWTQIITYYEQPDLYFLSARSKITGSYLLPNTIPTPLGASLPKTYWFDSLQQVAEGHTNLDITDEGFVGYDIETSMRVKFKNPGYVALHLAGDYNGHLNDEAIRNLIIDNEVDEFIAYFPKYKEKLTNYLAKYKELIETIPTEFEKIYNKATDRKNFAKLIHDRKDKHILFRMYDTGFSVSHILGSLKTKQFVRTLEK